MKYSRSPLLADRLPAWRARLVLGLLLAASLALIGRAFYLQGIKKDFLISQGEARYERVVEISATRGRILDRHGDVLAISTPVKSVWAIPEDARLTPAQVRHLAGLLAVDTRDIARRLDTERNFVYIKRRIAPDIAAQIAQSRLPGIHFRDEYRRFYPAGEASAHILGFTGADDVGQEGVELALDNNLAGRSGSRRVIKDRRGQIVEDVESIRAPREGKDVTLALDARLQHLAHSQLKLAVDAQHAKAGSIVVLDAKSGELLALANLPTYNPNNRRKRSGTQLRNRAFTDSFEPGSTFKPFAVALALEKSLVNADTPIESASGRMTIGNATISDVHPHGLLSVAEVIQKSSNVGTAKIALGLPAEAMWTMFANLGFGQPLRLGFPGEAGGRLRPWQRWRPIEQATMSYGHGVAVTLIQLARAYQVFAREGDLVPISLTRSETPAVTGTPVFSRQTAHTMRSMLEMAVQTGGTGTRAQVPGYRIAGKTGTANKLEGGVYTNRYISSFVGFAPASNPRLLIAVMIDEPAAGKYFGGEVAAPVFAAVMGGALRILGVPPDDPARPLQMANALPAQEGL